jgi:hypothetical protein
MITDINSEDRLVQKTFADHLRDPLGWESVYTYMTRRLVLPARWAALVSARWCWCGIFERRLSN